MLLEQRLKIEGKNQMKINLDTFIFNSDWNFQITYKPAENINKQMIICTAMASWCSTPYFHKSLLRKHENEYSYFLEA